MRDSLKPPVSNLRSPACAGHVLWPALWGLLLILGAVSWAFSAMGGDSARAWRALLINFIYFSPLAAGMVAWPAVVALSRGRWSRGVDRVALGGLAFAPASVVMFGLLWHGRANWATWIPGRQTLPNAAWLNPPFMLVRDLVALALIWIVAAWFTRVAIRHVRAARQEAPASGGADSSRRLGGWFILVYCTAWTLLSFDLVMALDPRWFSTLFGLYFAVTGMYAAVAMWTLVSLIQGRAEVEQRHDLGRLVVTFSLLSTYMMYSQLLPIWYENLPHEVLFVAPRFNGTAWRVVGIVLLGTFFLGPLVLLLTRWSKRTAWFLGAISVVVLVTAWVERWWEVAPTAGAPIRVGLPELAPAVACLAALALGLIAFDKWAAKTVLNVPQPGGPDR